MTRSAFLCPFEHRICTCCIARPVMAHFRYYISLPSPIFVPLCLRLLFLGVCWRRPTPSCAPSLALTPWRWSLPFAMVSAAGRSSTGSRTGSTGCASARVLPLRRSCSPTGPHPPFWSSVLYYAPRLNCFLPAHTQTHTLCLTSNVFLNLFCVQGGARRPQGGGGAG